MTVQGNNGHNNGTGDDSGKIDNNIVSFEERRAIIEKQRENEEKSRQKHPPMINLPPATKTILLAIIAVEIVMKLLLDPVQQYWVIEHFGFIPSRYGDVRSTGWSWPMLTGPVTYAFVHGGWMHVGLNGLMLMAFGSGVERWMGWKKTIILMLGCSLVAALAHLAFNVGGNNPVIGASGAISGLFAAALIMLKQSREDTPGNFRLLPMIAVWIGITIIFGMMGGPGGENIAWIAHIGGFLAGLALVKPVQRIKI